MKEANEQVSIGQDHGNSLDLEEILYWQFRKKRLWVRK